MRRRKGFVLVTVVLLAALLMAAAFVFSSQTAAEQYIGKTNALSKSALSLAETGIAQVFEDFRVTEATPTNGVGGTYLTLADVRAVASSTANPPRITLAENPYQSAAGRDVGTYRVSITRVPAPGGITNDPVNLNDTAWKFYVLIRSEGRVYAPGTNLVAIPIGTNYMVRRIVQVTAQVVVNATYKTVDSLAYAILAGSTIKLGGNAVVQGGDMRSNDQITIANGGVFEDGKAYSTSISPNDPVFANPNYERFTYPTIDVKAYQTLAKDLVGHSPPYDGSDPAFGDATVHGGDAAVYMGGGGKDYATVLTDALTALNAAYVTSTDGTYRYLPSVAPVRAFVSALTPWESNASVGTRVAFLLRTAVYYVEDLKHSVKMTSTDAGPSATGGTDGDLSDLSHGTIVVGGSVDIAQQSVVGGSVDADHQPVKVHENYLPSLYATGDINVAGGATLIGLFHSDGQLKATGGMTLFGALQAKTLVTVTGSSGQGNSDQYKIVYDPRIGASSNVYLDNPTPTAVNQEPGSWVETSQFP